MKPETAALLRNDRKITAHLHALFCLLDSLPDKSGLDVEKVVHKIKTENFLGDYPLAPDVIACAENHTRNFLAEKESKNNPPTPRE